MGSGTRVSSSDVLREVQALRVDLKALSKLLIGSPDEPDKPGLVERMRLVESTIRLVKWVAAILGTLMISDVVARLISWYRGGP